MFWLFGAKKQGVGKSPRPLLILRPCSKHIAENKSLRSDNRVSVVGLYIFCFKVLIRFGGLFLDKGAPHGGVGGGYFNNFHESILVQSITSVNSLSSSSIFICTRTGIIFTWSS